MRISDVEHELVALHRRPVTDARDDERFGERGDDAFDHVGDELTVQAVSGFRLAGIAYALDEHVTVLHFGGDEFAFDFLTELSVGSLNLDDVAVYGHGYLFGDSYG